MTIDSVVERLVRRTGSIAPQIDTSNERQDTSLTGGCPEQGCPWGDPGWSCEYIECYCVSVPIPEDSYVICEGYACSSEYVYNGQSYQIHMDCAVESPCPTEMGCCCTPS
jgi:hypothetical protein